MKIKYTDTDIYSIFKDLDTEIDAIIYLIYYKLYINKMVEFEPLNNNLTYLLNDNQKKNQKKYQTYSNEIKSLIQSNGKTEDLFQFFIFPFEKLKEKSPSPIKNLDDFIERVNNITINGRVFMKLSKVNNSEFDIKTSDLLTKGFYYQDKKKWNVLIPKSSYQYVWKYDYWLKSNLIDKINEPYFKIVNNVNKECFYDILKNESVHFFYNEYNNIEELVKQMENNGFMIDFTTIVFVLIYFQIKIDTKSLKYSKYYDILNDTRNKMLITPQDAINVYYEYISNKNSQSIEEKFKQETIEHLKMSLTFADLVQNSCNITFNKGYQQIYGWDNYNDATINLKNCSIKSKNIHINTDYLSDKIQVPSTNFALSLSNYCSLPVVGDKVYHYVPKDFKKQVEQFGLCAIVNNQMNNIGYINGIKHYDADIISNFNSLFFTIYQNTVNLSLKIQDYNIFYSKLFYFTDYENLNNAITSFFGNKDDDFLKQLIVLRTYITFYKHPIYIKLIENDNDELLDRRCFNEDCNVYIPFIRTIESWNYAQKNVIYANSQSIGLSGREMQFKDTIYFNKKLGEGSYASVYYYNGKAYKIWKKETVYENYRFIYYEYEIYKKINNKINNIVHYYGIYDDSEKNKVLVLEYMNKTLENLLDLTLYFKNNMDIIAYIAEQILIGLDGLHNLSIIHCDIKLSNILINKNAEIKIADFGLSIDTSKKYKTKISGTNGYFAPELIFGLAVISNKNDIWSFGICILHLLGFKSKNPNNHVEDISDIRQFVNAFDIVFKEFIMKCFKSFNERPTAKKLLQEDFIKNNKGKGKQKLKNKLNEPTNK